MRFNNPEELINYANSLGESIKDFDIVFTLTDTGTIKESISVEVVDVPEIVTEMDVQLTSLSNNPVIVSKIDESIVAHVLEVVDYSSVPFSCSTGKVSFMERTIFTNICESDTDGATISLDIKIGESTHRNVPFRLEKTSGKTSDYIMKLNPKLLPTHE